MFIFHRLHVPSSKMIGNTCKAQASDRTRFFIIMNAKINCNFFFFEIMFIVVFRYIVLVRRHSFAVRRKWKKIKNSNFGERLKYKIRESLQSQ